MDIAISNPKRGIKNKERVQEESKKALVKKEKISYERLIQPIESQMMRSIWRIVRNQEAAEDTLQDSLTIIWRKLSRIYKHPNPHALILKICINSAYDTLRKQRRHIHQNKRQTLSQPGAVIPEALEKKNIEFEILDAIQQLPRKQALATLMRIVQDQPYDSIAQVLGCSEVTARIHVSKARERLSQRLSYLIPTSSTEVSA